MSSQANGRLLRITAPLLLAAAVSVVLVFLVRPYVRYQGATQDVSSWGAFFTVFGVIYAIVAGFLLVTVLNRYSSLCQTIEDELNAIESIRDFLVYFESNHDASVKAVRQSLGTYAHSIANVEWQEMADPSTPTNSDTSAELYEIIRNTSGIQVESNRESAILSAMVACIADLAKLRTRRIALANERLPVRLRVLLVLMSISLAAGFYLIAVESFAVHVFMASTLTVSVYLLYWIIEDLDHPFYGIWNVNRQPLDELVTRFEEEIQETVRTIA